MVIIASAAVALSGCQSAEAEQFGKNAATTKATAPRLVWSDEFNGAAGALPDATKWNFETGGNGWGNGELECYTSAPGNVSQNGSGDLVITAIRQPGHICSDGAKTDYTSARLTTANKFTFSYGTMEVRAKVPTAPGLWPAFWSLGANEPTVGWPQTGEIDAMEVVGSAPSTVHGSIHGPLANNAPYDLTTSENYGTNLADAFHIYAATWTPTQISYSIDGHTYGTITKAQVIAKGGSWVFTKSNYLLLDLAVGGGFPGPPTTATTWPQQFDVDWVRVYSL